MDNVIITEELQEAGYRIEGILGYGASGMVYLVSDSRLGKQWAMKVIEKNGGTEQMHLLEQMEWEAQLMKQMDCDGIPAVVDKLHTKHFFCLVMEYVDGLSLEYLLEQEGSIRQEQAVKWGMELAEILAYLHECQPCVLYLDMKPANIMIRKDRSLKLIDFGAAIEHQRGQSRQGEACAIYGTYGYCAPEQLQQRTEAVDCRSDIYSLGVTLYHMVTGCDPAKPPHHIQPVRDVNPALSTGLERIILKCTEEEPENRYQTCHEVLEDLKYYKELERRQIWKRRGTEIVYFLLIILSAFVFGIGLEGFYIEKWHDYRNVFIIGGLLGTAAYAWEKSVLERRRKRRFIRKQKKHVFLTAKKAVGLWTLFFLFGIWGNYPKAMQESTAAFALRHESGEQILIREGGTYYTDRDIILELLEEESSYQIRLQNELWRNLPHSMYQLQVSEKMESGEVLQVTLRARNPENKEVRVRSFYLVRI